MAISRAQLAKELEPGLNALFGLEYNRYENEHGEIFEEESSDRAFEEEVMLGGLEQRQLKVKAQASALTTHKKPTLLVILTKLSRLRFRSQKRLLKTTFMIVWHPATLKPWLVPWLKPSRLKLRLS